MTRRNRLAGAFRECAGNVLLIGKVLRGTRVAGLIWYLCGPGRREEHLDPHLVAGWRDPAELEPAFRADGTRDFRRINGLLNQPLAALGRRGFDKPVWHCVVRAAPDDSLLSDAQWARIAEEIMHRTSLARSGDDKAVRWMAIRHAPDHVHIVATLARQDGTKPRIWNDFYRVREACLAVERRYGLRITAPGDRTAGRRPTRAENEHARWRGWEEPARTMLRRAVHTAAAGATSEREFFARLEAAGVLVRKRFSQHDLGQVTGYAVAKPGHVNGQGTPVWFGGGKLAADLTPAQAPPAMALQGTDINYARPSWGTVERRGTSPHLEQRK
jgi:MobA/VirD2-like, nuclease domain